MAAPLAWFDKCWVSISTSGGSEVQYGAKTGDISFNGGENDMTIIRVNTGDIPQLKREEPFELKFENCIPITADDFRQLKEGGTHSTQPMLVTSGADTFTPCRVALLWTDLATASSGAQAITSGSYARRIVLRDAYVTAMDEKWGAADVLTATVTVKVPAVNPSGSGNVLWQSVNGTASMGALAAYTGGNFT